MRIQFAALFTVIALLATAALSQVLPKSSTNYSSTIAVTNTFQQVQGSNNGRQGCAIQNNGTHNMNVYFGTCTNATAATSVVLSGGQSVNCIGAGNVVLTDAVCITGTAADAYFANFQ